MAAKKGKGTKKSGKKGAEKSHNGKRPAGSGRLARKRPGGGSPKDWGGGTPKGWPWDDDEARSEGPPLIPPGDGGLGGY